MSDFMEPAGKDDEPLENKRKRLIFRSDHRGTKEMDLFMGKFAATHVPKFNADELAEYDVLLCQNDPDLYNWITQKEPAPAEIAGMSVFIKLLAFEFV